MDSFGTYGIGAAPSDVGGDLAPLLDEIAKRGFCVLRDLLPGSRVDQLNASMDQIYERQCAESGGESTLADMNDADIVRCLLAYDDAFIDLATHPTLVTLTRALLGDYVVLLMQNGVINRPDRRQFQTNWHRDLNYQHWVCNRPIAISILICLEDFNLTTGGTAFLPGSHLAELFPSDAAVAEAQVTPDLPRGSAIVFNSMVFHRAGVNRSGRVRRAVNHVIGVPILGQQIDMPAMLGRAPPADPWLAGFLGYRWNPAPSVAAWRRQRIVAAAKMRGAA